MPQSPIDIVTMVVISCAGPPLHPPLPQVTTPTSSEKKKTKKDKGKNAKSPVQNASIDEESFQTPPKGKGSSSIGGRASSSGKKKKKGPEMSDSARKTVTFGVNMAKGESSLDDDPSFYCTLNYNVSVLQRQMSPLV